MLRISCVQKAKVSLPKLGNLRIPDFFKTSRSHDSQLKEGRLIGKLTSQKKITTASLNSWSRIRGKSGFLCRFNSSLWWILPKFRSFNARIGGLMGTTHSTGHSFPLLMRVPTALCLLRCSFGASRARVFLELVRHQSCDHETRARQKASSNTWLIKKECWINSHRLFQMQKTISLHLTTVAILYQPLQTDEKFHDYCNADLFSIWRVNIYIIWLGSVTTNPNSRPNGLRHPTRKTVRKLLLL